MSPVKVLAQLIADVYSRRSGLPAGQSPAPMDGHVASSLIASGVFHQTAFTTASELDELPLGSVVRTVLRGPRRIERFFRRMPAGWFFLTNSEGDGWPYTSSEVLERHSDGTATYVWNGDKQ
ncbi:hypothetical protein [Arthrobacter sp. UYCo732]|uniref:hypothetical protein n=1 Tax=Arthrobacter sp. UYCo732 TaxID=3156336 RepID=UPI0033916804